jgi:hypothetical protein
MSGRIKLRRYSETYKPPRIRIVQKLTDNLSHASQVNVIFFVASIGLRPSQIQLGVFVHTPLLPTEPSALWDVATEALLQDRILERGPCGSSSVLSKRGRQLTFTCCFDKQFYGADLCQSIQHTLLRRVVTNELKRIHRRRKTSNRGTNRAFACRY